MVSPTGNIEYNLCLENPINLPETIDDIVLVDVLPHAGDRGVVANDEFRQSVWQPTFTATSLLDLQTYVASIPGATLFLSTVCEPCLNADLGAPVTDLPSCSPPNWSTTPPPTISGVCAFKIEYGTTFELAPGDQTCINLNLEAPATVPTDGSIAWNSFGFTGNKDNGDPLLASEPIKVGIASFESPCTTIASPVISITDNVCNPASNGSINVDTDCAAGSTIEYSTDMGATWSTTAPAYDVMNAITVRARCADDNSDCGVSSETADVTSNPTNCGFCEATISEMCFCMTFGHDLQDDLWQMTAIRIDYDGMFFDFPVANPEFTDEAELQAAIDNFLAQIGFGFIEITSFDFTPATIFGTYVACGLPSAPSILHIGAIDTNIDFDDCTFEVPCIEDNVDVCFERGDMTLSCDQTQFPDITNCLLYTSPSPRDQRGSRMPSSA